MRDQVQLTLNLNSTGDTDDHELERMTRQLRREILDLDVEDVELVESEAILAGAKGTAVDLGALIVTALASSEVIAPLIDLIKSWLTRHSLRSVTLEIDGDKLEVTGVSSKEQKELIDAWMSRHPLILTP